MNQKQKDNQPDAEIVFISGFATLNGSEAQIGDSVPGDSVIQTEADSDVEIVFGTGNILQIRENTIVRLDLLNAENAIDIESGAIAAVFDKLQSIGIGKNDTYKMRTPTTVAGVRGTVFFIAVESRDATYICACHGTLAYGEEGDDVVTAVKHKARRFIRTDQGTVIKDMGGLYHDSQELNVLADTVDVTIPWGKTK